MLAKTGVAAASTIGTRGIAGRSSMYGCSGTQRIKVGIHHSARKRLSANPTTVCRGPGTITIVNTVNTAAPTITHPRIRLLEDLSSETPPIIRGARAAITTHHRL